MKKLSVMILVMLLSITGYSQDNKIFARIYEIHIYNYEIKDYEVFAAKDISISYEILTDSASNTDYIRFYYNRDGISTVLDYKVINSQKDSLVTNITLESGFLQYLRLYYNKTEFVLDTDILNECVNDTKHKYNMRFKGFFVE